MGYEERYKELFSKLVSARFDKSKKGCAFCSVIDSIMSELVESEDERIREWLINYPDNIVLNSPLLVEKESCENALAWLKKQGEQKPINEKAVFEVGETITDGTSTFTIADIVDGHYIADDGDKVCFYVAHKYYTLIKEQKPAWNEEDEHLYQIIIDILDKEEHKGHLSHADLIACVKKLKSLHSQNR